MSKRESVKSVLDAARLDTPWGRRLVELELDGITADMEVDGDFEWNEYELAVRDAGKWCSCAVGELKSEGVLNWERVCDVGDDSYRWKYSPADAKLNSRGVDFLRAVEDADWLGAAHALVAIHERADEMWCEGES